MTLVATGEQESSAFEAGRAALLKVLLQAAEARSESFDLARKSTGLELRRSASEEQKAGRPRILLFPADRDRIIAFFYKPSRLSFSTDRFSYGALYLYAAKKDEAARDFESALDYLAADFKPAAKPKRLKRSLDVTVPEED